MSALRAAAQQALEALEWHYRQGHSNTLGGFRLKIDEKIIRTLRSVLAQQEQEPVAWTDRELELIDGMIEVQLHHAAQCDGIANRPMAERQKGWDMERVALLRKIKSISPRRETEQEPVAWMVYTQDGKSVCVTDNPADFTDEHRALPLYTAPPRREWQGLTEEEREQATGWSVEHIEGALKEKNYE